MLYHSTLALNWIIICFFIFFRYVIDSAKPGLQMCAVSVLNKNQGWEFAHLLICSSLIHSFPHFAQIKWATVSNLLRSNEQLWAVRSDRSRQMSDHERIAQVTQRKWVTLSKSLRSLKTNEWPWAIPSGHSWW